MKERGREREGWKESEKEGVKERYWKSKKERKRERERAWVSESESEGERERGKANVDEWHKLEAVQCGRLHMYSHPP